MPTAAVYALYAARGFYAFAALVRFYSDVLVGMV